jgi:hypothetical protein
VDRQSLVADAAAGLILAGREVELAENSAGPGANPAVAGRAPWRWLLPSLSQWLWLLLLAVLLAQPWRTMMVASDGDACMHWRVGEHMLQTGRIVRADLFSHTRAGEPFISKEWLSELCFALAGRWGGLYGLAALGALVIASGFGWLHRQLLREGNDALVATLLVLLGVGAASMHWLARPHAFSFLMIVLWHDALRRHERDGDAGRLATVLCPLSLLWVNLHGAFLAGFVVLGAYWVGTVIELALAREPARRHCLRRRIGALAAVGALCLLVSLLNPNGWRLHLHNIAFLRSDFLTGWLAEYSSTNFHRPESWGFLGWLALMFFTFALLRPRLSAGESLVVISWTYFALYAGRNIPLLAILTAPILAPALSQAARQRWGEMSERIRQRSLATRGWPVVAIIAVVLVGLVPRPTAMPASDWPVEAVAHIRAHPGRYDGNMFNQYVWGGYLMWYLPEHKVFVDGRTDFYGEGLIREFQATTALATNWTEALEKYRVDWTLMPSDHRLNRALELLPGQWEAAHTDAVATIFRRIQPEPTGDDRVPH